MSSRWICALCFFVSPAWGQTVPAAIAAPEGQVPVVQLRGEGQQIYTCKKGTDGAFAWTLKAPEAKLTDESGKQIGRHSAGPTWETEDGSKVVGKMTASVPAPDAGSIPWLLIHVTSPASTGMLQGVESIQRLDTQGGVAPKTGCDSGHEGTEQAVPYSATYRFLGDKRVPK